MIAPTSFDPWVAGQGRMALAAQDARTPKDAAQAFEALLVRQILSAARSSSWLSGESETESGWREMADDALAGHLARVGGLGLAKQIASLLGQASAPGLKRPLEANSLGGPQRMRSLTSLNAMDNSSVSVGSGRIQRGDQPAPLQDRGMEKP